ncbi:MAG: dienelactone hydrolase family protein [Fimbriimonadaceae bacterium]
MNAGMVNFKGNGREYQGYLSPSSSGKGPGIVVIQEWWGLVGHIKAVADRFAQAGFTALAPDFYHGKATTEPDEAGSLMMALNIDDAAKVIHGAVDFLLGHEAVSGDKVGVIGFCMGGQLALYAATIDARIGGAVDFYGIHPNVKPDLASLGCPLLGIFAENDAYASPEAVRELSESLTRAGKAHEFHTYPGTQHAFFNDERPEVFDESAANDAWLRVLSFFEKNVGVPTP